MTVFAIKRDHTLALRAFSSVKAANEFANNHVFSSVEELTNTRLSDEELRSVYLLVTGFETRVPYRDYLCELLFKAIIGLDMPLSDSGIDFSVEMASEETESPAETSIEAVEPIQEPATVAAPEPTPVAASEPEPAIIQKTALVKPPFRLSRRPVAKTKYSKREECIFDVLVENHPDKLTTDKIVDKAFARENGFHLRNTVVVMIASLRKKIEYNNEKFRVCTTSNSGPYPMKVWIEPVEKGNRNDDSNVERTQNDQNA